MLRLLVLSFFGMLPVQWLCGQPLLPRYLELDWGTQTFDMAPDDAGCFWLGSTHGLYRYDGASRELMTHDPEDATSITFGQIRTTLKSRSGAIWLGSWTGGLSRFDPKNGKAETFLHHPEDPNSLSGNQIAGLLEDEAGGLWIGASEFTLNYLPKGEKKMRRYPAPLPPEAKNRTEAWALGSLAADSRNPDLLWIGSRYGIFSFTKSSGQFQFFPFDSPIQYRYTTLHVAVFPAPDGSVWAGGWNSGVYRFDPVTQKRQRWMRPDLNDKFNSVAEIKALDDSTALVLFRNEQWGEINWKRQTFVYKSPRLGNHAALADGVEKHRIYFHPPDNIWVCTSRGLYCLTQRKPDFSFHRFLKAPLCPTAANWQRSYALAPDGHRLYMGTLQGDGLLCYDWRRDTTTVVPYRANLEHPDVWMDDLCFAPDGRLWIGSDAGLLWLETAPDGRETIRAFVAQDPEVKILEKVHITSLAFQKDRFWVGTNGAGLYGLSANGAGRGQRYSGTLPGNQISKILVAQNGDLWVGTEAGLAILTPDKQTLTPHSGNITDIQQGVDGRVWVSTLGNGLLCFDGAKHQLLQLFSNRSALGGNVIYSFCLTRKGDLWVGHDSGLARLNPVTGLWTNYDQRDGLSPHYGPVLELPDGQIASATIRGVRLFHPDSLLRKESAPRPYLKSMSVFEVKIPLGHVLFSAPEGGLIPNSELQLRHDENELSFDLGAVDFGENARPHFACLLEGYDQTWQYLDDQTTIRYAHIPPGRYRFRFKAANRHDVWSEEALPVAIYIRAPFWKTWWFRSLLVLSALGLAVALLHRRERRFRERESVRQVLLEKDKTIAQARLAALQARMNPHFLFNCLNAINWFVLKGRMKEASVYLTRFSRLVRAILEQSKHEFIPLSEELATLRIYIEMESLRFLQPFEWRIECAAHLDPEELLIPPMLLQPLVENAIWHGLLPAERAGILTIKIEEPADGQLYCFIEDNGVGRAAAAATKSESRLQRNSEGLEITRERLAGMGSLEVTDCFDETGQAAGTRVALWLNITAG